MKGLQFLLSAMLLTGTWGLAAMAAPAFQAAKGVDQNSHQIFGIIRAMRGSQLTIETRDKRTVAVDATVAVKTYHSSHLAVGGAVIVQGTYDAKGVLHAEAIQRAKSSQATWPPDR